MANSRGGVTIMRAILLVGSLAVAAWWVSGHVPPLQKALETTVSAVKDELVSRGILDGGPASAPGSSSATAPVAGGPAAVDAGPPPFRRQTTPLSSAQLGAPLVHGSFVSACGAPDDMKVVVDVTVKMGRAVHVTAKTAPPNPAVAECVERAAHDLRWDVSPKTDHVTVTY